MNSAFYPFPGPSSIGSDLCFHGFSHVYGVPEHADGFQLRDTRLHTCTLTQNEIFVVKTYLFAID